MVNGSDYYEFEARFTGARKGYNEEPRLGVISAIEANTRDVVREIHTKFEKVKMHAVSNLGAINRHNNYTCPDL